MSRLKSGLRGLKAAPSAPADDQDFRHSVMLPVRTRLAHRHMQCQPHRKMGALLETREGVPAMPLAVVVAASVASGAVASVSLKAACVNSCRLWPPRRCVT
jgi:hypothetical protein